MVVANFRLSQSPLKKRALYKEMGKYSNYKVKINEIYS